MSECVSDAKLRRLLLGATVQACWPTWEEEEVCFPLDKSLAVHMEVILFLPKFLDVCLCREVRCEKHARREIHNKSVKIEELFLE